MHPACFAGVVSGPRRFIPPVSSVVKLLLPLLAFFAAAVHAQTVRWEPGSGTLAFNQLSELSLVFEQCEPADTVSLPSVPGLQFAPGQPGRSESTSYTVVNFKAASSKTVTLTYRVRPSERRTIRIPAFTVETDKGRQPVASASFEVADATVGQTSLSLDSIVQSRFTLPSAQVWAGEVFPLTYSLNVTRRYFYQLGSDLEWNPAPLSVENWGKPEPVEAMVNGDQRLSIVYKTRAYAKSPGVVPLNPATQLVNLTTGASSGFGMFTRQNLEQFSITSQPASLTVRPLPSPAPAGFSGAVGKFTLESKIVPASAAVGEPVTWTLTLAGTGNWPDLGGLPPRSVSKDFRVVQPQAKRANKDEALFDASLTEDIVLIPTKPGSYTLGPVTFSVFNPATGAYESLTTPPTTITVAAAASQPAPPATPAGTPAPSTVAATPAPPPLSPTAPAAAIPRDPLPPAGAAISPASQPLLLLSSLASLLLPLGIWITLALRRARVTDPNRPLREARERLAETLRELAANPAEVRLIRRWQRDTATLWRLPAAVPTSDDLGTGEWSALWADADRTLYGTVALPADWPDRARRALAAHPAPAFSAFQLFLPRNLLPLLLVLTALASTAPTVAAETDARSAYDRGDFSAAASLWTAALKTTPTDWTTRHNLALALSQQNRHGEAAGHALAAFVQQPQNEPVRWHLAYTWKAAGVTPVALSPFLTATPAASLARLASPARWQAALVLSAWLATVGTGLWIYGAYHQAPRPWRVRSLLAVSVLLAVPAAVSLKTYGPLADARTVVVVTPTTLRSIPTDLETTQKASPLALGVVATTDKTLLGWRRLVFPDGQTGWVRAETLVPLWRSP